jgi:hypothetical protein
MSDARDVQLVLARLKDRIHCNNQRQIGVDLLRRSPLRRDAYGGRKAFFGRSSPPYHARRSIGSLEKSSKPSSLWMSEQ